jgi:hypothetical protein
LLDRTKTKKEGYKINELPRSKLQGISLAEFIDLIEASFEELNPQRLKAPKG